MKRNHLVLSIITLFILLTACGPAPNIVHDGDETKLMIDDDRHFMTFYVRLLNEGTAPSNDLYAVFYIVEDLLVEALDTDTILFDVDEDGTQQPFSINAESSFFIAESFPYENNIPLEQLKGAVEVALYDGNGKEVTRFSITQVELENEA